MSKFASREALVDKIQWEGGLEGAFAYGIKAEDMPEGDELLQVAWARAEVDYAEFVHSLAHVRELLEDYFE